MTLADITMIPKNTVAVEGKAAGQLIRLIDALEDLRRRSGRIRQLRDERRGYGRGYLMKILGIDPGSRVTGYGVVSSGKGG